MRRLGIRFPAMRTWTFNRRGWGLVPGPLTNLWPEDGPWHNEPDKAQWIDKATDLDCLARRNRVGCWCGYVGVPPGHPCHGMSPWDLGYGLNYGAPCDEDDPEGVCHVPEPGRPANVWWLGFDCGHYNDVSPLLLVLEDRGPIYSPHATYKPFGLVCRMVEHLAGELAAYADAKAGT